MCTGRGSNQGPLGPKSDALTTAPLRLLSITSVVETRASLSAIVYLGLCVVVFLFGEFAVFYCGTH